MERKNELIAKHMDWIDIIKIISAFLVVLQHSISGVWTSISPNTTVWKIMNFIFILSRSAVPLFFMCSGVGMLHKARNISDVIHKNIFKIIKLYVAWMIVHGFVASISLMNEGLATFSTVRNAFIKKIVFGEYFTWFIIALIGLYLITPFLSVIVQNERLLRYFIILSVIFTVIIPLTGKFSFLDRLTENINNFHMHFVVGYVLYYVCGYYISRVTWKKKYTVMAFMLFILSYVAAFILSNINSTSSGLANQEVYGEFSPLGFLINISIFAIFKAFSEKISIGTKGKKLVCYGIGIYLLHPLFLEYMIYFPDLYRIVGAILLYLVCIIICMIIEKNKLLKKLLLNGA